MTEAKKDKSTAVAKSGDERIEELSKIVGSLRTEVARHSANWVKHMNKYHEAGSGRVGACPISAMLITAVAAVLLGIGAVGATEYAIDTKYDGDSTWGTYKVTGNKSGRATLTVDAITVSNLTATGAITGVPGTIGAANGSAVTATESYSSGGKIILVIDDLDVPIINGNGGTGTNWTGGVKIYDFAECLLDIESVLVSDVIMATSTVVTASEGGDWACGTTIEAGNTLATSTAVDLCPATSTDAWITTNSNNLAAGVIFDGTAAAKDMYFNVSVDSGDISGATTVTVDSATIQVNWKKRRQRLIGNNRRGAGTILLRVLPEN